MVDLEVFFFLLINVDLKLKKKAKWCFPEVRLLVLLIAIMVETCLPTLLWKHVQVICIIRVI